MTVGFKNYVWECLQDAPSAYRRGAIAVTILANVVIALGLYLGWHLNAFTALQLSTAAVAIAALELVLMLPYRLWKSNKAEIAALRTQGAPFPDWKIRELFYHFRPDDLLENENWLKVGGDVLDKLSTGQITAWGRRGDGADRRPLQRLDTSFWNDARFTYVFLADENSDDSSHAYVQELVGAKVSYSDVQFSKAQALRVWSK
jgi:hypothetical protein